ncbi:MAG TPA: hypothetical protein VMD07_02580 [Candidatus Acidoferrales bacterium]|nr:hypothetical protein [Candidatus Acidoferrales bacterium]
MERLLERRARIRKGICTEPIKYCDIGGATVAECVARQTFEFAGPGEVRIVDHMALLRN